MNLGRVFKAIGRTVAKPVTVPAKVISRGADKAMQAVVMSTLRRLLIFFGGGLVGAELVSGDELNAGVSAIVTLATIGWSLYQRRKAWPAA